jgi:hypothetical protein
MVVQRLRKHQMKRLTSLLLAALLFVGQAFALTWQEVVNRSSGAIVRLEGLSADGQYRMTGTGFFITSDGVLITNRHIAEFAPNGSFVAYSIWNERLGTATLEADTTEIVDLAVMKVNVKKPVVYLRPHKRDSAQAGDRIIVLGFPDKQFTISMGNLGGFTYVEGQPVIELRVDVTHGSSGSPVLDTDGNAIGVILGTVTGPNPFGQKIEVNSAEPIELTEDMVGAVLHKIHPNDAKNAPSSPSPVAKATPAPAPAWEAPPTDQAKYYFDLGHREDEAGDYTMAISDLDESIRLDPNDAAVYATRGVCYARLKRYQEAIDDYTKAIQCARSQPAEAYSPSYLLSLYDTRALFFDALGQHSRAAQDRKKALELKGK